MTRVYGRSNVPYDRFKSYIEDMRKKDLIVISQVAGHSEITISARGIQFLDEYTRVKNFLIAFGLEEPIKQRTVDLTEELRNEPSVGSGESSLSGDVKRGLRDTAD